MLSFEIIAAFWMISVMISLFLLEDDYNAANILFAILGGPLTALFHILVEVFNIRSSKYSNCEIKYELTRIIVEYDKFLNECNNKNKQD